MEIGGLLGVTQQMSQFARSLGSPPKSVFDNSGEVNPFLIQNRRNPHELIFGNPHNVFKSIGESSSSNFVHTDQPPRDFNQDMEMAEPCSRELTNTPELDSVPVKISSPEPTISCWNSKSPTIVRGPMDNLNGSSHALHSISEEITSGDIDATSYLASRSSYDLAARQATPCNSPNHLRELERSFTSPDAPSPIRPTTQSNVHRVSLHSFKQLNVRFFKGESEIYLILWTWHMHICK